MKKSNTPSLLSVAHLLFITCAIFICSLCLSQIAVAQNNESNIINANLINVGTVKFGTTDQTVYYHIPTTVDFTFFPENKCVVKSLEVASVSFNNNATLTVDGSLTTKHIDCSSSNAKMIFCPNALVDLEASTLIASSLTLADGTEIINGTYSFNDGDNTLSPVPSDLIDSIPSFKLSNGAKLIHGTLIIDSTQANAVHLVESNEHSSNQDSGTITLSKPLPLPSYYPTTTYYSVMSAGVTTFN